ncbi:MAG: hypothetical protein HZB40_19110, partial [Rhodocyclales bacterium]|nr:hypothetical protein [Rhodocyclales bacterium]
MNIVLQLLGALVNSTIGPSALVFSKGTGGPMDDYSRTIDPNRIDSLTFNPSDGQWYAVPPIPSPWPDQRVWSGKASPDQQAELNRKQAVIKAYNEQVEIHNKWHENARKRTSQSNAPQTRRDPLILDLDSNGIATTNAATNDIHFDHDANGFAESTGWLNPNDAYLAWDRNGNGTIDSGNELFGDQTTLRSGAKAVSGLQALAEWDTTKDGQIDAADTRYNDLRVWRDLNQDGISQTNELQTLTDAGIAAISLVGTATNAPSDANGNTLTRTSSFTRTDTSTGASGEVAFKRDTALSIPTATYLVTDTIAAQPDLSGYGNLLDLHQALAQEVGAGDTAIAAALAAWLAASDPAARDTALDQPPLHLGQRRQRTSRLTRRGPGRAPDCLPRSRFRPKPGQPRQQRRRAMA